MTETPKALEALDAGVEVELGGEIRRLRYTLHSIAQIHRLTGKNLMMGELDTGNPEYLLAVIWGGLIPGAPELDGDLTVSEGRMKVVSNLQKIGNWLDMQHLATVTKAIFTALSFSGGEKGKEGEGKNP